jgi:hypothetical protein
MMLWVVGADHFSLYVASGALRCWFRVPIMRSKCARVQSCNAPEAARGLLSLYHRNTLTDSFLHQALSVRGVLDTRELAASLQPQQKP